MSHEHDESAYDRRLLLGLAGVAGLAAVGGVTRSTQAGPLNPPTGAVTGTGKTLTELSDKIDTRPDGIPITAATTPGTQGRMFRITQPGKYYFPAGIGLIDVGTNVGILDIVAPNVDVDLNGRTLANTGGTGAPVIRAGVGGQGAVDNITIRNGTVLINDVLNMPAIQFPNGITNSARLEHLRLIGGGIAQINSLDINGLIIRHCLIANAATSALLLQSGTGAVITDTHVTRSADGFYAGSNARIERCSISSPRFATAYYGANVGAGSVVRDCAFNGIGSNLNPAVTAGNGSVIERNLIQGCINAISVGGGCTVADNTAEGTGGGTGIRLTASGNRVMRNMLASFGTAVQSDAGAQAVINNVFRSVTNGLAGSTTGSLLGTFINSGNFATQTNPYANLYI